MPSSYILRSTDTDIAFPKPRTEFLKKSFKYSGANFGIAFLEKQKKRNQFLFLNKISVGSMQGHTSSTFVYSVL